MLKWIDKARPCKIGTIPTVVLLDNRSSLNVGNWVRVQYVENGDWEKVLVTKVQDDGYFMADR